MGGPISSIFFSLHNSKDLIENSACSVEKLKLDEK